MPESGEIQVIIPTWWRPTFDATVAMLGLELFPIPSREDDLPTYGVRVTDDAIAAAIKTLQDRAPLGPDLWPCGCLPNDAGAHRVGCPDYPGGIRG